MTGNGESRTPDRESYDMHEDVGWWDTLAGVFDREDED